MAPECSTDMGRVVTTWIGLVEQKTFVGKCRRLKLVFPSSSLGITLLLSSGHCFGGCMFWKYLSLRVSWTCANQAPKVGSESGKSPSCLCLSSPQTFITEEGLCAICCTCSFQRSPLLQASPEPLELGDKDAEAFKATQVCSRGRILHDSSSDSLHSSVDS